MLVLTLTISLQFGIGLLSCRRFQSCPCVKSSLLHGPDYLPPWQLRQAGGADLRCFSLPCFLRIYREPLSPADRCGEGKPESPENGPELLPLEGHQVEAWRGRALMSAEGGAWGGLGGGAPGRGLEAGLGGGPRGRRPVAPPARGPWSPRGARPAPLRPASRRAAGRPSERGPGAGPGQTAGGVSAETLSEAPERRGRGRRG